MPRCWALGTLRVASFSQCNKQPHNAASQGAGLFELIFEFLQACMPALWGARAPEVACSPGWTLPYSGSFYAVRRTYQAQGGVLQRRG